MTIGDFDDPMPFKGQEYKVIKKSLQKTGTKFEDIFFKPGLTSLSFQEEVWMHPHEYAERIVWKRPHELAGQLNKKPRFFVNSANPTDCVQGALGNCWFVSGCSLIAQEEELWSRVIPDWKEQEWDEKRPEKHTGIFHFRFYRHGDWFDVVVDDQLPCMRMGNGQFRLVFLHSETDNEFWSALLEKAFAKSHGSYGALRTGTPEEALIDFTGGIAERIDLGVEETRPIEDMLAEHFRIMEKEVNRNSLLSSSVGTSEDFLENESTQGIIRNHAYSIITVRRIPVDTETKSQFSSSGDKVTSMISNKDETPSIMRKIGSIKKFFSSPQKEELFMIKLRNPHGSGEWKGRFSDSSDDWNKISSAWKSGNNIQFADDGEFWMLFDDFCTYFDTFTICRRVNKSFFSPHKKYYEAAFHGAWASGRCGGCGNLGDRPLENPQYIFDVEKENGDEDVMIYLEQKKPRKQYDTIGFRVMKVELNRKFRLQDMTNIIHPSTKSTFINSRGVFMRQTFEQGRYLIIPSTFEQSKRGNFLLRLFTSEVNHAMELTHESGASGLSCIRSAPLVTRVCVDCVKGLTKKNVSKLYCVISYDCKTVRTRTVDYLECKAWKRPGQLEGKAEYRAEWNEWCIFYTYNLTKPIKVVVYNEGQVKDDYIAKAKIDFAKQFSKKELTLTDCKKLKDMPVEGTLTVSIQNSEDGF